MEGLSYAKLISIIIHVFLFTDLNLNFSEQLFFVFVAWFSDREFVDIIFACPLFL